MTFSSDTSDNGEIKEKFDKDQAEALKESVKQYMQSLFKRFILRCILPFVILIGLVICSNVFHLSINIVIFASIAVGVLVVVNLFSIIREILGFVKKMTNETEKLKEMYKEVSSNDNETDLL